MADDTTPAQDPESEEQSPSSGQVTRRQFLIGAGVGAVVGVAGATGVLTLARPTAAPEQAKPAAPQTTTQAATTTSPLVEGPKLVTLNVNGLDYVLAVPPHATLFEVLKRDLGLTGVKLGCNGSMCSACTVLVNGVAQNSCSLLAIRESGKKIVTIEGLEQNGKLHPVQVAFWENQGYQCGFCTPGQILGTVELLSKTKNPTEEQIRAHLSGHMCKCSAYPNIVKSVQAAAKLMT
jgi:aerobic-type carbon monoxide dehydrogenase small subunit (CoxS/CutS family)